MSSCSCERGRGGGWGRGGGERRMLPSLHEHTCQCTQADAWPRLVADAAKKNVWRATNVHPCKPELARRVSVTRARKRPAACGIVGAQCMDRGWQPLRVYISTQLHSNVFRYTHSLLGGIGFRLRRISAVIVGCSLLVQIFEQLNCNYAKNIGFLTIYA